MERTKIFTRALWTAGAAAVLLGVGAPAHAIKIDGGQSVTYAKETLRKAVSTGDATTHTLSGVTYYVLEPAHAIAGPAEITAAGPDADDYEVVFSLTNMVFSTALAGGSLLATTEVSGAVPATFTLQRGGAVEDNFAVFAKVAGEPIRGADMLTLTAEFAVTGDGPGGIARTIMNEALPTTLPNIRVTATHTNPNAVKVARALKETVTLPSSGVVEADASDDFMSFTGGSAVSRNLRASLGTLMVSVESGVRDARVASDSAADDMVDTTMVSLLTPTQADGTALNANDGNTGIIATGTLGEFSTAGSAVTFSGDFSFIKMLALPETSGCSGSLTELRAPSKADPQVLTDMTIAQGAGDFSTARALCVVVDGETAIPDTEAYTVTTEYKGPAVNAFPPVGGTHNLAMIKRGGTTVHIPYLTTYEGYNQRLVVRNRSAREVSYTVTFTTEDAVTASPMSYTDMIAGNSVKMTRIQDVVTLSGGSRTAATVTSNAASGTLGVATTIVNREDRSTDTQTHSD